ncbi:DUF1919 domain-containing protein [Lactococcus cremoris]|uniref:DUF1919 domain-containing protein n=1 Tax=Lactococcus lactis subsp. cremoris TaxID=1359 RepID=UPI0021822DC6|nr:DUF1919 domain-containing protein [Lactococcus cremoris]MBU6000813.1 DUF1919 domain-containing protein [Lactococcus lactis]
MTIKGIRQRISNIYRKVLALLRRIKLNKTKFTIFSNNCWGGGVYESYDLIKQSPTVGLFFMSSDYVKFLGNIKGYLKQPLVFINPKNSKYYDKLKRETDYGKYPVAKLDDIEIFFMHYTDEQQALSKWNRRIKRINWNHVLYKFNDQNGCTQEDIDNFIKLPYKNKICFTVRDDYVKAPYIIKIKAPKSHHYIRYEYEPYGNNKYINVNKLINKL